MAEHNSRLQPSINVHAQLQPLCSAALVPNVLPRRDEDPGKPCTVTKPYSILAPLRIRIRAAGFNCTLCVLVYKSIHGNAPTYLLRHFIPAASIPGRAQLRAASIADNWWFHFTRTVVMRGRNVAYRAPLAWNNLPPDLRNTSLDSFRRYLLLSFLNFITSLPDIVFTAEPLW